MPNKRQREIIEELREILERHKDEEEQIPRTHRLGGKPSGAPLCWQTIKEHWLIGRTTIWRRLREGGQDRAFIVHGRRKIYEYQAVLQALGKPLV